AHALPVEGQRTERADGSAARAQCLGRGDVWDEDLAQDPARDVPIEPRGLANTVVGGFLLGRPPRVTIHPCLPGLPHAEPAPVTPIRRWARSVLFSRVPDRGRARRAQSPQPPPVG